MVIVSETLAQRMFPNQDAVNRHVYWTDPVLQFFDGTDLEKSRLFVPHRIIGVTADIDDEHVVPEPILTVYSRFEEVPILGGRLFIHTSANPYSLVTPVTRIIRAMSADQPIERAATLEDIRAEVLTPDRLNSLVFGRIRGCRVGDCSGGRRRRAGVFGERANAGIRYPAGPRIGTAATPQGRDRRGHRNGCGGRPCRRGIRIGAGAFG